MGLSRRRENLFRQLAQSCSISQAVETGTWQGSTTRTLREIFPIVISVELIEEIWRAAKQRNQDLTDVEFILGESGQVLNKLEANHGSRPTLFYLDAHCGSFYTPEQIRPRKKDEPRTPAGTTTQCPLEAEIAAIDKWGQALPRHAC